ncbi:hypothetical protein Droror1_Dr00017761 [Drosera rotundifolia]
MLRFGYVIAAAAAAAPHQSTIPINPKPLPESTTSNPHLGRRPSPSHHLLCRAATFAAGEERSRYLSLKSAVRSPSLTFSADSRCWGCLPCRFLIPPSLVSLLRFNQVRKLGDDGRERARNWLSTAWLEKRW